MKKKGAPTRLVTAAGLVTLSSLVWGYSISVLNVCLVPDAVGSLLNEIALTNSEQELATALVLIGAWMGALITNAPADKYGRKPVLLVTNVLYLVGTIVMSLATGKESIYVGRLIIGLACGGVTGVVPTLLTELAPADIRGQITTLHQLQLTIGILASGVLGYFIVSDVPSGWRYVNAMMAIPVLVQLILFKLVPESPRWLAKQNRVEDARKIMFYIRSGSQTTAIENEVDEMVTPRDGDKAVPTWTTVFSYKKQMILGSALVFFQAMTGINTVIFYSAKVFSFAGVKDSLAATASVGTVNVLVTVLSVYLVDSYGRRRLLLVGTTIMTGALVMLSTSLFVLNSYPKFQGVLAIICTLTFVGGFAIGFGAVVWVILGEILPTSVRSRAMGFFMAISYLCNIFIATCTLSIINALGTGSDPEKNGIAKLYLICSVITAIALTYIVAFVPETKNTMLDNRKEVCDLSSTDDENSAEDPLLREI